MKQEFSSALPETNMNINPLIALTKTVALLVNSTRHTMRCNFSGTFDTVSMATAILRK